MMVLISSMQIWSETDYLCGQVNCLTKITPYIAGHSIQWRHSINYLPESQINTNLTQSQETLNIKKVQSTILESPDRSELHSDNKHFKCLLVVLWTDLAKHEFRLLQICIMMWLFRRYVYKKNNVPAVFMPNLDEIVLP